MADEHYRGAERAASGNCGFGIAFRIDNRDARGPGVRRVMRERRQRNRFVAETVVFLQQGTAIAAPRQVRLKLDGRKAWRCTDGFRLRIPRSGVKRSTVRIFYSAVKSAQSRPMSVLPEIRQETPVPTMCGRGGFCGSAQTR